jgi:hypothetical protein
MMQHRVSRARNRAEMTTLVEQKADNGNVCLVASGIKASHMTLYTQSLCIPGLRSLQIRLYAYSTKGFFTNF